MDAANLPRYLTNTRRDEICQGAKGVNRLTSASVTTEHFYIEVYNVSMTSFQGCLRPSPALDDDTLVLKGRQIQQTKEVGASL